MGGTEGKLHDRRAHLATELKDTLKLAAPIVLNQVGHMSMGLVDTIVAGRISTPALAGLGLAANVFWTFTSVCLGCLFALDTLFSQSVGAKDDRALARYFGQAWWAALLLIVISGLCILGGTWVYWRVATPSLIVDAFVTYLTNILWCLPSLFPYFILQRYWQAQNCVVPFTIIILGANVLNLTACSALGLGLWGLPRLEVKGIAWATVLCRYLMLLCAILYTWRKLRPQRLHLTPLDRRVQGQIFRLGLPAASHTALEVGAFTIATFIAGSLGGVPLAAHHVCLMMAAFTFMFPYGFSQAAAVRVGTHVGAGRPERARLAGWLCIGLSLAVMSLFAGGYLLFPKFLLRSFTQDPAVIDVGSKLLVIVAFFQLADGTQVSTTGALRGLGNTRTAMLANLIGHYPVGLALGLVLCYQFTFGVVGLWSGLAAGLITVALILITAWLRLTKDPTRLVALERA